MSLILDAGAFLAVERGDPFTAALIKIEMEAQRAPLTHGGVIGQVWRGGAGRQARVAKLMAAIDIAPLDDALGRRAGVLLARARRSDVIDAAVVLLAADGDSILTSDPDDIEPLAVAAGLHIDIIPLSTTCPPRRAGRVRQTTLPARKSQARLSMVFHGVDLSKQTQISATISAATRKKLDEFVDSRGLKKNFVVEQALLYFIEARRELPDEAFIPTRLVLESSSFDQLVRLLERSPAPTDALRKLMRGDR